MKTFGIDISRHNRPFDLAQAQREGVKFAIIKAGGGDDGLYKDAAFEEHYQRAKILGIPVGAYFFSRALDEQQAIKEADFFFEIIKGKQFDLPVYIDVEDKRQLSIGKDALTGVIHAFCQQMEYHGYWVGIYSSKHYFLTKMHDDQLQRYAHWVAQWYPELAYDGTCGVWQFGGELNPIRSNRVAGKVCDQDYMLVDYPTLIKKAGLNGFRANPRPAELKRGDAVKLKPDTHDANNGKPIASFVYDRDLYVAIIKGDRIAVTINSDLSGVTAWVNRDRIIA